MEFLTQADVDRFHEEGFLVVNNVLDVQRDIQPVVDEYTQLLDDLCTRWFREGALSSSFDGLPFGRRLQEVVRESGAAYTQHFDISLPQKEGIPPDTPIHVGPNVFDLLTSPRLLDAVEAIVGPEIYSNPVQHTRIKIPERLVANDHKTALTSVTPWHQDQGVVLPEADETDILTVWLPITNATVENGCLALIPGSHRASLLEHCPNGKYIPDSLFDKESLVPAPVKRGSVLFMHHRTVHGSLPNESDDIRWSFDLRYHAVGRPTGRPQFPGFVARSRSNPTSELKDYRVWGELWRDSLRRLSAASEARFHRWSGGSPVCA